MRRNDAWRIFRSFRYAAQGMRVAWREGLTFKIDIALALVALILSNYLRITRVEWAIVLLTIGMVLSAEIFNTALEELCDKFQPEHDPHIGRIKDLAAAAVLVLSLGAFFVGVVLFSRYL